MLNMEPLSIQPSLDALLPKSLLDGMVSSFEAIFTLDGAVALRDSNDQLCYGPDLPADERTADAAILVSGQEVGRVGLYSVPADPPLPQAIQHLALSLSHLATQAWRERRLSSEVLQRYDELNLIYDLGTAFTQGLSQDQLIEAVLNETNRIVQAEAGVIYIWDSARTDLTPVSYFGDDHDPEFWQGRMRELALSTLYAYQDAQLFEGNQVICAPLRHNDGLVGSLMLVYEQPDKQFTANDIHLLSTLSHNTALFIEAARLYEQLTQRNTELEATLVELKSTRDKLSRAERLSIIGQTVSGLIHDMKSPLGIVMGYAGLLQEPDINFEQRYEFACQIIRHIEAFSAMAQEILDYIQGDENIQKTRVEVSGYLAQIHNLLVTPGLQRPAEIVVNSENARGSSINVDPQRFARVFQNLVNNALDAIGSKGGSRIEISAELDGAQVRFMVTDDGPGVPPDLADAIFEPFVTHGKRHGTGLGLAIVRRMVAIHGGEIRYEPAPGRGARFIFTLPLATEANV